MITDLGLAYCPWTRLLPLDSLTSLGLAYFPLDSLTSLGLAYFPWTGLLPLDWLTSLGLAYFPWTRLLPLDSLTSLCCLRFTVTTRRLKVTPKEGRVRQFVLSGLPGKQPQEDA